MLDYFSHRQDHKIQLYTVGPPCQPYSRLNAKKRTLGRNPFLSAQGQVFEKVSRQIRNQTANRVTQLSSLKKGKLSCSVQYTVPQVDSVQLQSCWRRQKLLGHRKACSDLFFCQSVKVYQVQPGTFSQRFSDVQMIQALRAGRQANQHGLAGVRHF